MPSHKKNTAAKTPSTKLPRYILSQLYIFKNPRFIPGSQDIVVELCDNKINLTVSRVQKIYHSSTNPAVKALISSVHYSKKEGTVQFYFALKADHNFSDPQEALDAIQNVFKPLPKDNNWCRYGLPPQIDFELQNPHNPFFEKFNRSTYHNRRYVDSETGFLIQARVNKETGFIDGQNENASPRYFLRDVPGDLEKAKKVNADREVITSSAFRSRIARQKHKKNAEITEDDCYSDTNTYNAAKTKKRKRNESYTETALGTNEEDILDSRDKQNNIISDSEVLLSEKIENYVETIRFRLKEDSKQEMKIWECSVKYRESFIENYSSEKKAHADFKDRYFPNLDKPKESVSSAKQDTQSDFSLVVRNPGTFFRSTHQIPHEQDSLPSKKPRLT